MELVYTHRIECVEEELTKTTIEDIEWCWSFLVPQAMTQWQLDRRAEARGTKAQTVHPQTVAALYWYMFREEQFYQHMQNEMRNKM
tara:strand:+ start:288 stop:545 length:258 start_codon:yes stop_codon:yes gene_type:complete